MTLGSVQDPLHRAVNYFSSNIFRIPRGCLLLSDQSGITLCLRIQRTNTVAQSHKSRLHGGLDTFGTALRPVRLQTPEGKKQPSVSRFICKHDITNNIFNLYCIFLNSQSSIKIKKISKNFEFFSEFRVLGFLFRISKKYIFHNFDFFFSEF